MTLLKVPIAFIISLLLTQVAFAAPITVSLETLVPTTIVEGDEEGYGSIIPVLIKLSAASDEEVTVTLRSHDHDAFVGIDYVEVNETFTFAPGQTTHGHIVRIIPNIIDNPYERKFMLMLHDPVGAKLGEPILIITILDDDEVLWMESTSNVLEKDEGEFSYIDVVVKREFDGGDEPVFFNLQTKDGTALAGLDYVVENFEGVLLPGELEKTFRFTIVGDNEFEEHEYFYVNLIPQSESTKVKSSEIAIFIQDNDGEYYFSYDLDVFLTPRKGEFIKARSTGEVPLERLVDEEGNVSYEGEAVITHTDEWSRIGRLPTQPSRTRVKFYGIGNVITPESSRVEWSVGPDEHLRCSMPPPMGMPMNCIWWAAIVNYHKNVNWTPANSQQWGTFLLKGFEHHNKMENSTHSIAVFEENLNYTLPGPMVVKEKGTYKIIRKVKK